MVLPILKFPTYAIKQPSTQKEIKFRPYLVKEEKILLMAKQSGEIKDVFQAVKDILSVCCLDKNIIIENLPLFDLEYIFLKLRAVSVKNRETAVVTDSEDKMEYPLLINFDEIEVNLSKRIDPKIDIGNDIIIFMKYPTATIYEAENNDILEKLNKNDIFELVVNCVEKIYQKDSILKFTKDELKEFLENLDIKNYQKMKNFLINIPKIEYKINYVNNLGHDRYVRFRSLMDFFLYL